MPNFQPTLRIEFTTDEMNALEENAVVEYKMFNFNSNGKKFPQFKVDRITVIETGEVLEGFVADIVATFQKEGVNYIQTASGDVIPLKPFLAK